MTKILKKVTAGAVGFSMLATSFVSLLTPLSATAQTSNPLSLPLFDPSGIYLKGTFSGVQYYGSALGVSEDGQFIYSTCGPAGGIAKYRIPAVGGTATQVAPCQGPDDAEIKKIIPGWGAGQPTLGGILEQGGRVVVSAFGSYDANGVAIASHWGGTSLTQLSGPFRSTISPGLVKGSMGHIPVEWRTILGGSAFSASDYTSIISRQSAGATFSVFDPATVTGDNFPMTMLLGCPYTIGSCQTWTNWGPSSDGFQGTELAAGSFIVPGTRTFIAMEREASGTVPVGGTVPMEGYGYPTNDISLHGKPYPSPEGVIYIYSLSDPNYKGNKGYPYRLVAKMYDMADFVAVKQGTKQFQNVKQYRTFDMPGSNPGEFVQAGTFNHVTKEYYLYRGGNVIYVYGGFGSAGTSGGGDTVSPTVSITAPSSGSTVTDTVTLSANATDNVSVAGVQFKVDGVNVGSEDTTAPYSVTWDSKSVANGSHSVTAVVRDSSYNTTISSVVSVNVNNVTVPPPTDPVGHWKFDETSGAIADDISTSNNDGSLFSGATFATGKVGNAVNLDGVDDYVAINNTNGVLTPSKITVATWVNPANAAGGGIVLGKGDSASEYYLRVYDSKLAFLVNINGTQQSVDPIYTFTNGNWYHIAGTYDGSVIRAYINGVEVASKAVSGSLYSTPGNITVGKRGPGLANYFKGAVDDLRVYARALSASEVQSLYTSGGSTGGGDVTNPTVSISSPTSGASVSGSVTLSANATDNVSVAGVQFKVDGVNVGSEDTTAPYSVTWDSKSVANGSHSVTAVARDTAGNTANASVSFTTNNTTVDTVKPTVNITAPTSYTAIKGVPILVTADATDNVGVVGVQFKLDGVNLNTEDLTSAYSTLWDTTNAADGTYSLTAVARDAAGNSQTSAIVTVTISTPDTTDTTKPTVSMTSPVNDTTVSGILTLTANASDNVGVVGVQFMLDGANLFDDTSAPYSTTWDSFSIVDGLHTFMAVARDAAGNTQTSNSIVVNVDNNDEVIIPPTIVLTSPASGSSVSNTVTVSADATDNVGIVGVQFRVDGVNVGAEDATVPYSISWNTKLSGNGNHLLTAVARDVEGNQTTSSVLSVNVVNDVPTTGIKIGDSVKTTAWVNVRSAPGGKYLGSQRTGKTGTITSGPGYANSLTWWKVNFTSGVDGWVAGNYLTKTTVAMTEDDYRKNIANIYLIIKYLQERLSGQN